MSKKTLSPYFVWFVAFVAMGLLVSCQNNEGPHRPKTPADIEEQAFKSIKNPKICSFNIQFLGNSKLRKNKTLAQILKAEKCSMVAVQEIVAPPDLRLIPNNPYYQTEELPKIPGIDEVIKPQPLVTEFFLEMQEAGFDRFSLSEQDTGPIEKNNNNSSATEWWAVFYQSKFWQEDPKLPKGFLDEDVTKNDNWDRVPYAFAFQHKSKKFDFILINVHLRPGAEAENATRRAQEIQSIREWIEQIKQTTSERDFVILGDFNIENDRELKNYETEGLVSLNSDAAFMTNTNLTNPKPYDHVFIHALDSSEIKTVDNFYVTNLIQTAAINWDPASPYPGSPYNHNLFRLYFSDHHPVAFIVNVPNKDDD